MELPQGLPGLWHTIAWIGLAALLGWAAWRAPWNRLKANEQSHVFLGSIVAVALLWMVSARVGPALHFHLLGATVLYLMFGAPLALVAVTLAAAAATLAGSADWAGFGGRVLAAGAVPVAVSHVVLRVTESRMPPNFFVYVFGAGFVGGGLAMAAAGFAAATATALGASAAPSAGDAWVAVLLMLAFGEATLTGMLITLFVVYLPSWVGTFSDARYLRRRP